MKNRLTYYRKGNIIGRDLHEIFTLTFPQDFWNILYFTIRKLKGARLCSSSYFVILIFYILEVYRFTAKILFEELDQDFPKIIDYIRTKLDWPLSYKCLLLHQIKADIPGSSDKLNDVASFMFDPISNIKRKPRFDKLVSTMTSMERQYGSGVSAIFRLQIEFFLVNLLTLIVCLALITIPYDILKSSATFSNSSFSFSSIFTTKDYLSESIFFQGAYSNDLKHDKYDLPLIYLLTIYVYFFIWMIFITVRFSSTYKQKIFDTILSTKLDIGFVCTFGSYDYSIGSLEKKKKHRKAFERRFLDLIESIERIKRNNLKKYETFGYKLKFFITNLFYVLLAIGLGKKKKKE